MRKVISGVAAVTVLAALAALGTAGTASAATLVPNNCDSTNPTSPCIRYCYTHDGGGVPCGVDRVPEPIAGNYSFSVPLSAATQDATGVAGDPGGTGNSSITMDAFTNSVCATTSWSGIDSPVVMAHIHGGAYGQPENPGITISLFEPDMLNGRSSPASGCTIAPPGVIAAINRCPQQFNVVVHSQKHPVGAIRGQLGSTCRI